MCCVSHVREEQSGHQNGTSPDFIMSIAPLTIICSVSAINGAASNIIVSARNDWHPEKRAILANLSVAHYLPPSTGQVHSLIFSAALGSIPLYSNTQIHCHCRPYAVGPTSPCRRSAGKHPRHARPCPAANRGKSTEAEIDQMPDNGGSHVFVLQKLIEDRILVQHQRYISS
jgi:hypothetical protein